MPENLQYAIHKSLPLEYYPESTILVSPANPVTDFNTELRDLIMDMVYTMQHNHGIGLAAPQIGIGKRLFVWLSKDIVRCMVNPIITGNSSNQIKMEEGCLSIPGLYGQVKRPLMISVTYYDAHGKEFVEAFEGMSARVIQHEIDHLDGWLFPFYLIPEAKKGEFKPLIWTSYDELTSNYLDTKYEIMNG
jgi:peptide deformylase